MPRYSGTIDDTTPMTGGRIDIPARLRWLLRTHRTVAGVSLRQMVAALREAGLQVSAATLSRVESEGTPSPGVLDGYNAVLGLPSGQLRTAAFMQQRSFSYAPALPPEDLPRDLDRFTAAYDAVTGPAPTAGEWLLFARHHASEVGFGLPRCLMGPLLERLVDETPRGVSLARIVRYEALHTLSRTPYRDVVIDAVHAAVADPHHQAVEWATGMLDGVPAPRLLPWAGELLAAPSRFRVRGAAHLLQSILVTGRVPLEDWRRLVPAFAVAWEAAQADPDRVADVAMLFAALPVEAREDLAYRIGGCLPDVPRAPVKWDRRLDNAHYGLVTDLARSVVARIGQPQEPLLARLLFEAFYEPRGVRMSNAAWLVSLSAFAPLVRDACFELARRPGLAPETLTGAMRVGTLCHDGSRIDTTGLWDFPQHLETAQVLSLAGRSGIPIPGRVLERGLAGDETARRQTLYALGMSDDPRLREIAADPARPEAVRRGAEWWLRSGPRILA
ncbi:hypothetical protein ACFP3Q_07865 [Nocardioides sp. GCM10027113]|uniref:hypothetical protein n=1 Tax=unclassified Nocardioides TaxID=2615069 RepID=UPI00361A476C